MVQGQKDPPGGMFQVKSELPSMLLSLSLTVMVGVGGDGGG